MRPIWVILAALLLGPFAGCLERVEGPSDLFASPDLGAPAVVRATPFGLTVDGEPFLVKGVVYGLVPAGLDPLRRDRGWSFLYHPEHYHHDLRLIKAMGANTLRLVATPPDCEGVKRFLDAAAAHDLKVILGIAGPRGLDPADPEVRARTRLEATTLADCHRDHPAVLLWMIGSGVPRWLPDRAEVESWYTLLDEVAGLLHHRDPNHPVATAETDLAHLDAFVSHATRVDAYAIGHYAPESTSWSGLFGTLAAKLPGRTLLVSDFGFDAWDSKDKRERETLQADLLAMAWDEIAKASAGGPVSGGVVHEWTDAWWKSGSALVQDEGLDWRPLEGASKLPDGGYSEDWFGIARLDRDDETARAPRAAYARLRDLWTDPRERSSPSLTNLRSETNGPSVKILADVTTHGGVPVTVSLTYRVKSAGWVTRPMEHVGDGTYAVELGPYPGFAVVFYKIRAEDAAGRVRESAEASARSVPDWALGPILGMALASLAAAALGRRRR
ncbi:MAG TPA: hypothetical protein VM889_13085 [Candidatus Thermoplasmatota archaeon]|nr:hypothetical protein [Candidatus Thermoplasmatota archaeon]